PIGPDALHGTHVGGIVGAIRDNNIGMDGIAPNVKLMVIRAVPDGDERDKDVANAIRYAVDNGASIINMSFGKSYSPEKNIVDEAVKYAEKNDVLLVHAAGNSAENIDVADNFPNAFLGKSGFIFKKNRYAKNWIEVGALSYKKDADMVAGFSNYGSKRVDLFAPGVQIFSTTPNNQYRYLQGTSMAAPVVAGVAAVLRSHFPTLTAIQVKEVLMKSTIPFTNMVKQPGTGKEVPFNTLSVSGGVVNLYKAYELAEKTKGKKKIKVSGV
ncbi:MAG TPA: S8 family serine peptidase, partial [Saprospiraceae bacterium]|nr:S8 family serine peptidase [Saprospiraceae bacterium]